MFSFKRYIRVLRLKNCARRFARKLGERTDDGWTYDDGKLRICIDKDDTLLYYPNYLGERKLLFAKCNEWPKIVYFRGEWEKDFADRYNSLKHG